MRVCVIGEGMVELSRDASGAGWRVGHGGDTLNMAIHLARFGLDVAYVTALGADPFSDDLRAAWIAEGLDPATLLTDPARTVGLYAISTDAAGERAFAYWRGESAARTMFDLPAMADVLERARSADLIVLSLITLAILTPSGREALLAFCRRARARGARVAFDGNYRPRLWPDAAAAAAARDRALGLCDFGLPSLDDEQALSGRSDPVRVAADWSAAGCAEVAVKLGARGAWIGGGGLTAPERVVDAVDTSGAGDGFDAGYLAARLEGRPPLEAAVIGCRLAAWVVGRPGAIPPRDAAAPYRL